MNIKEYIVSKLTDAYNKNPNSNLSKVIGLVISEVNDLQGTFLKIEAWRSIDDAEGKTLDDIGRDLSQYRGVATDEVYRIMLKSKVARDLSTGDTNTIIEVLAMTLDTDKSEIGITETWMDEHEPEPCGIKIIEVPIRRLNEAGMSSIQFAKIVERTVAAGIAVKSINLQGTFEYGGDELVTDMDAGFSNVEMTTGGFYGTLYEPGNDRDLPI